MASVVEELEFLIQMYKKASNKQKFLVVMKQLFSENDFSKEAYELMRQIVIADQGGMAAPAKVAPRVAVRKPAPTSDGCSGGFGGQGAGRSSPC